MTLIRIGSVTKTFTSLSLLTLDADGKLSLDSKIASLTEYPPYSNPWAASNPVTLAQLLEHSAGLIDLSRKEWDKVYRIYVSAEGYPPTAYLHYRSLRLGGWRAYAKNAKDIIDRGYVNWEIYRSIKHKQWVAEQSMDFGFA